MHILVYFMIYLKISTVVSIRKLIWISMNGVSSKHVNNNTMPFLHGLKKYGAFCNNLENNFLAQNYPALYSMSTGFYPRHHGILSDEMLKDNQSIRFSKTRFIKDWWMNKNFSFVPIWFSESFNPKGSPLCIDWPGCQNLNNNYNNTVSPIVLPGDPMLDSRTRISIALHYATKIAKTSIILVNLSELLEMNNVNNINEDQVNLIIRNYDFLLKLLFHDLGTFNVLREVFKYK